MMYHAEIKFWDLGRNKAKGEFIVNGSVNEINLAMRDKFSRHLLSREISFDNGVIYAGFRSVGKYSVISTKIKEIKK